MLTPRVMIVAILAAAALALPASPARAAPARAEPGQWAPALPITPPQPVPARPAAQIAPAPAMAGATTPGAATQGATTQGATTQGATTQGATTQGATTQGAIGATGPQATLVVVDQRPDEEKKTRILSSWIFSCNYAVQELGDDVAGDRIGRLRDALSAQSGARPVGARVVVDHYALFINALAETVSGPYAETRWPKCAREKMAGGWFRSSELSTPYSPFVVEMEVHIDGRQYQVHSVFSPPKNVAAFAIGATNDYLGVTAASRLALDRANAALIAQLSSSHP